VSNAKNNFSLDENNLFVYSIFVNDGPILKRWRPRAMGRAAAIQKRTCTINIILDELSAGKEVVKEEKEVKKVEKVAKSGETVLKEDK
jgi:hypothetical protein